MTTLVKVFKNRRSATGLLKKLGRKPYEYDSFIQPNGAKFQITIQDGNPVSKIAMLAQTEKVAEALTAAAETVAATVEEAIQTVEAVAASVVSEPPREETDEQRDKRVAEVDKLRRRYAKLEEIAAKKKAKPPRKKKAKPKSKRKVGRPRGAENASLNARTGRRICEGHQSEDRRPWYFGTVPCRAYDGRSLAYHQKAIPYTGQSSSLPELVSVPLPPSRQTAYA
jgi:hypothetical protein